MKVNSRNEAWLRVNEIFPTDYAEDGKASYIAGYPVYKSTVPGCRAWISDLWDRLEVNLPGGDSINIWIEEKPRYSEDDISDALRVISNAIYEIDDRVAPTLQVETGINEARSKLYGAYAILARILKEQHPESKLYRQYNLQDA